MSATTTAIWVMVIGTGGATMRAPLLPAICYLLDRARRLAYLPGRARGPGVEQRVGHEFEVLGRAPPLASRAARVEDRAAADQHVDVPAGHLSRVAQADPAVHADQHVGAGLSGQLADGRNAAARVSRRGLAGPARVDGEHQDEVGQLEDRLDRLDRSARVDRDAAQE